MGKLLYLCEVIFCILTDLDFSYGGDRKSDR